MRPEELRMPRIEFYRQLGSIIRAIRTERNITQEALAAHLGLRRSSISNIEAGRQGIMLHMLCDIAEFLQTNIISFLPDIGKNIKEEIKLPYDLPDDSRKFIELTLGSAKRG